MIFKNIQQSLQIYNMAFWWGRSGTEKIDVPKSFDWDTFEVQEVGNVFDGTSRKNFCFCDRK